MNTALTLHARSGEKHQLSVRRRAVKGLRFLSTSNAMRILLGKEMPWPLNTTFAPRRDSPCNVHAQDRRHDGTFSPAQQEEDWIAAVRQTDGPRDSVTDQEIAAVPETPLLHTEEWPFGGPRADKADEDKVRTLLGAGLSVKPRAPYARLSEGHSGDRMPQTMQHADRI